MNTDIEDQIFTNRLDRNLQNGEGTALLKQVDSRNESENLESSEKYYRRKGTPVTGGFNRLQMFSDGAEMQTREDGSYVIPNQYLSPGTKVLFGVDQANGRKVEDITSGPAWKAPLRVIAGGVHDAARGTVGLGLSAAEGMGIDTEQARKNFESYKEPEWLSQSSGVIEDIGRTMAQFVGGYASAAKGLAKAGMKQGLKKEILASSLGGQTFDPKEGNLATLFNEKGMLPEIARYLDSKMTESEMGEFHGRLAMVLEEGALGGGFAVAGKVMRAIAKSYTKYGDTLLQEGVAQYTRATGSVIRPSLGMRNIDILDQNRALGGLTKIAGGMQIKKGSVEQFMDYASQGGVDENLAKKAWNAASKNRLERLAGYMSPKPIGKIAGQRGSIDLSDGKTKSSAATPADFESVGKYFRKQIARGNLQRAEYEDIIKPTMEEMKKSGIGVGSPEQIMAHAKARRPEFVSIKGDGNYGKDELVFSPGDIVNSPETNGPRPTNIDVGGGLSVDYKEHLFTTRNPMRGEQKFTGDYHYDAPDIKGTARTSLFAKEGSSGGNLIDGKIFIHELQSDYANQMRRVKVTGDKEIKEKSEELVKLMRSKYGSVDDLYSVSDIGGWEEVIRAFYKKDIPEMHPFNDDWRRYDHIPRMLIEDDNAAEKMAEIMGKIIPSPSAFSEDKAWVRQIMRPIVEDAREQGVKKIVLSSEAMLGARYKEHGPKLNYRVAYPKIMRQYFKDIGVPDKNIHMPKKSTDSFWVELPDEVIKTNSPLPMYSTAGATPIVIEGFEDDK